MVCPIVILCWMGILAISARAAEIEVKALDAGPPLIIVRGELTLNDAVDFAHKTAEVKDAVVLLRSYGGNAIAGIEIGKDIHEKGFLTAVPSSTSCESACALAWLGGTPRFMAADARIGFHAAYDMNGGRPQKNSIANRFIRSYLDQLGLDRRAIAYFTLSPPERLNWLTIDAARDLGIAVGVYSPDQIINTAKPEQTVFLSGLTRAPLVDLPGFDFPGMPITDVDAEGCEARCRDDGACAAFTFNAKQSACFLKSKAELAVGNTDAVSGYREQLSRDIRRVDMTIQEATDYPGNDFDYRKNSTFAECLLACGESADCKVFTFVIRNQQCWLKNEKGSAEPRDGLISGIK